MTEPLDSLSRRLVKRLRDGNDAAWRKLYDKYSPWTRGLSRRLAHGRDDFADDIFQEIWLKAILEIDKYHVGTSFIHWLMRIAENYQRRCNYRTVTALPSLQEIPDSPHDSDLDETIRLAAIVEAKLSLLPKHDRSVLELHYFKLLSIDEVAVRLRIRVETARKWLTRAQGHLRKLLRPIRQQMLAPQPQRRLLSSDTIRHA